MASKRVAPPPGRRKFPDASATIRRVSREAQDGQNHGIDRRFAVLAAILVLPAWILRLLALRDLGFGQGATLFRGFAADLAATLCCLVMVLLAARWRRWVAVLVALLWVLLQYANYEHILALDAPLSLTYAGYLVDPTFLLGSGLALSRPLSLVLLLVVVGISTWVILKRSCSGRAVALALVVALGACLALWVWPVEPEALAWRRSHFLAEEMQRYLPVGRSRWSTPEPSPGVSEELTRIWSSDLSGEPWAELGHADRNILVVVLEGVSGAYLPLVAEQSGIESSITMPHLDRVARSHPTATRFIGQQRQTNRGLYALLCGRPPRLGSRAPRLNDYAVGPSDPCLPEALAGLGYHTVFLQASPLSFMMKGQAMPRLGFETVIGERGDEPAHLRSKWGIDDRAFLDLGFDQIRQLESAGRPWFLTLLTVGTHHPYTVPDMAEIPGDNGLHRAMTYLDDAVGEFIDRLESEGTLDSTLVVLTSDESAGLPQGEDDLVRTLSQNWSLAILMPPGEGPRLLEEPFLQSDLAVTLLDYLGAADEAAPFTGRSLFRSYRTDRPLFFANTHQGRVYGLFPPNQLLACREGPVDCESFELSARGLFSGSLASGTAGQREAEMLRAATRLSLQDLTADSGIRTYQLVDDLKVPVMARHRKIFDGQYLDVPDSMVVEVEIEGEVIGQQGWLHVRHDLVSREDKHYLARLPVMGPGDRFRLRYRLHPGGPLSGLICRASADLLDTDRLDLELEVAELRILPEEGEALGVGVEVLEESVDRRAPPPRLHLRFEPSGLTLAPCAVLVAGSQVLATECPAGQVVVGPRFYAPLGTRLEVVHRLKGTKGTSRLFSAVGSQGPPMVLAQSSVQTLEEGQTRDVTLSLEVTAVLNELVVALALEEGSQERSSFRVLDTTVTMVLP